MRSFEQTIKTLEAEERFDNFVGHVVLAGSIFVVFGLCFFF